MARAYLAKLRDYDAVFIHVGGVKLQDDICDLLKLAQDAEHQVPGQTTYPQSGALPCGAQSMSAGPTPESMLGYPAEQTAPVPART